MNFIEHLLHISPDGGNGTAEILVMTAVVVTILSTALSLHRYFPKSFIEFLEQLGKRETGDRFDN